MTASMKKAPGAPIPSTMGRPPEFSEDEVLEKAMRIFWRHGFEGTSLEDLQTATGLSRSSLYNAFGSKRGLFDRAMDRYGRGRDFGLLASLRDGERGLEDVHAFLDGLTRVLAGARSTRGCFMVNTMIEFGGTDSIVARKGNAYFTGVQKAFAAALRRAAERGEIAGLGIEDHARLLVTLAMGINVQARAGSSPKDLANIARVARAQTDAWRLSRPKSRRPSRSAHP